MRKLAKLNGWRRLWVTIAVGSMVYAIVWGLDGGKNYYSDHKVISGFKNPSCSAVILMAAGSKLSPKSPYDTPCWELYLYRSNYKDAAQTEEAYFKHLSSIRNNLTQAKIGAGLLIWVAGVALLYGFGAVVAWVVRGFRPTE